jgi:two-component system cell cycle response regulator CpdR
VGRTDQHVVLLVDDDPAVLAVLSHGLEEHGFRVVKAQSFLEALQRAKDFARIDVLASDVILPGAMKLAKHNLQHPPKHGIELMRQLIALRPGIKVILFSGHSDETINSLGMPPDTIFLRKPLTGETLARSIRELLSPSENVRKFVAQRGPNISGKYAQAAVSGSPRRWSFYQFLRTRLFSS